MKFHLPSFVIGYGAGLATGLAGQRLRPLMVAVAAAGYRLFDTIAARLVMKREDLQDLLAEARARVRHQEPELH